MTTEEVRAIYDSMASANAPAVRSFTVVIDNVTSFLSSGILTGSGTMRHLFQGGPGQRSTANLICRLDGITLPDGTVVPDEGIEDRLTGLLCIVGETEYRVMSANADPTRAILRLALDSADQVGL